MVKIVGFIQMYNEVERGNLTRCLDNLSKICDEICIYDDCSTDDSVLVARKYTNHIIVGKKRDFLNEIKNKKILLEYALKLNPDWILWLDADEIIDRNGTENIRKLCETTTENSFYMKEITLWRSDNWRRTDSWYGWMKFVRLWKNNGKLSYGETSPGLHQQQYPNGLKPVMCDFNVIHFGYSKYENICRRWKERRGFGVPEGIRSVALDESTLALEEYGEINFPDTYIPKISEKPKEIMYCVGKNSISKYIKENYVHKITYDERKSHIYHKVISETRDIYGNVKVLHVGCNSGSTTRLINDYFEDVTGLDINKEAIKYAKENYKGIKFIVGNICDTMIEEESFDLIFAFDILEHLYGEDLIVAIEELRNIIKVGGVLIVIVPNAVKENNVAFDKTHTIFFEGKDYIEKVLSKFFYIVKYENMVCSNLDGKGMHNNHYLVCMRDR